MFEDHDQIRQAATECMCNLVTLKKVRTDRQLKCHIAQSQHKLWTEYYNRCDLIEINFNSVYFRSKNVIWKMAMIGWSCWCCFVGRMTMIFRWLQLERWPCSLLLRRRSALKLPLWYVQQHLTVFYGRRWIVVPYKGLFWKYLKSPSVTHHMHNQADATGSKNLDGT